MLNKNDISENDKFNTMVRSYRMLSLNMLEPLLLLNIRCKELRENNNSYNGQYDLRIQVLKMVIDEKIFNNIK